MLIELFADIPLFVVFYGNWLNIFSIRILSIKQQFFMLLHFSWEKMWMYLFFVCSRNCVLNLICVASSPEQMHRLWLRYTSLIPHVSFLRSFERDYTNIHSLITTQFFWHGKILHSTVEWFKECTRYTNELGEDVNLLKLRM